MLIRKFPKTIKKQSGIECMWFHFPASSWRLWQTAQCEKCHHQGSARRVSNREIYISLPELGNSVPSTFHTYSLPSHFLFCSFSFSFILSTFCIKEKQIQVKNRKIKNNVSAVLYQFAILLIFRLLVFVSRIIIKKYMIKKQPFQLFPNIGQINDG